MLISSINTCVITNKEFIYLPIQRIPPVLDGNVDYGLPPTYYECNQNEARYLHLLNSFHIHIYLILIIGQKPSEIKL